MGGAKEGRKRSPVRPRIAAVFFPALPLEAVWSDVAGLDAAGPTSSDLGACAVRSSVRGRMVLVAVSERALVVGVRVGMTEAEARATCAELQVRDRESSLEWLRLERATELLFAYGPDVEVCPPSCAFVELGRSRSALMRAARSKAPEGHSVAEQEAELLEQLVSDMAAIGHQVTVALADDPDTARTLAEHQQTLRMRALRPKALSKPVRKGRQRKPSGASSSEARSGDESPLPLSYVSAPPGRGRFALSGLPLEALTWSEARLDPEGKMRSEHHSVCEAVRALGLRSVRAFAALGPAELGARHGEAGVRLSRRARGEAKRPLRRYHPPERMEESFELDAVTEDLEPLLFILRRLLTRLQARMEARQRAAGGLLIELVVEPGIDRIIDISAERPAQSKQRVQMEIRLARPTRSASSLFAIVREKVGGSLPGAVLSVRVQVVRPEEDRGAQLDLFSRRAQKTEALAELVGRLTAALGEEAVVTPTVSDTHRPESGWLPTAFSIENALAPLTSPKAKFRVHSVGKVVANDPGSTESLPEVGPQLSVVGASDFAPSPRPAPPVDEGDWPKPKMRVPEDEPPPDLPPRPLELLEPPEPARFLAEVLRWRGRDHHVVRRSQAEQFRTEWWQPPRQRLERDYVRVDTEEGAALWVFTQSDGSAFVHGVFD